MNRLLGASCVLAVLMGSLIPAEAGWFKKDKPDDAKTDPAKQVETFQPPPLDAFERNCEPYRKEAIDIRRKPVGLRVFYKPRLVWLESRYNDCKRDLMSQEFQYLKHVDIQQAPSLPRLKTETEE